MTVVRRNRADGIWSHDLSVSIDRGCFQDKQQEHLYQCMLTSTRPMLLFENPDLDLQQLLPYILKTTTAQSKPISLCVLISCAIIERILRNCNINMDESSYKSPKPYKSGILLTCPPAPRAPKSCITFDRTHLIVPSDDTDNDNDSKNSIDCIPKPKRGRVHHSRRPSDDIPVFFPKSSSILDAKNIKDEDLFRFYGKINSRPEASFTLKKRRRLNPEVSSKTTRTTRVSIEQFPVLPFPALRGNVVPPSSSPSSSATPTRPGLKIKPSTSSSSITMPRSSSDPNTLKKSIERRPSIPHVPHRRRSSIARCA